MSMNIDHTHIMKIAISIPDHLFDEVKILAKKNKTSRSRIFCTAVEEYLRKIKAQNLLNALDSAYGDEETSEEKLLRKKALEHYVTDVSQAKNHDNKTG